MAEIAGLVLGALPLAIWALEKYSEPLETFHRYRTTIQTFRAQLMIENYQLERTLESLGLGKNASRQELQDCFEVKFPQICHELVLIVQQMHDVTTRLTRSLDVSLDSPADKTQWTWSRVKHSFNTKKRNKVLDDLRHCNEALRRVAEKTELPEEADSSKVQELKLRFNPKRCTSIRECLSSLHRALGAGLCCACSSPHQAAVDLDWTAYESDEKQVYKVAISYKRISQPPPHADSWKKLHIVPQLTPKTSPLDLDLLALPIPSRTPSPISSIKAKVVRFASLSNTRTLPSSLSSSLSPSSLTLSSSSSVIANSSSSAVMASTTEVTSLCNTLCAETIPHSLTGYFKDPDKDPNQDDHRRFFLDPDQPDLFKITEAFQLKSLISLGDSPAGKRNPMLSLSAKQRYGIAAAIAWSVLHLGETPWFGEFWSESQANLFLEKNRHAGMPDSPRPYLSYIFSPTPALPEKRLSSEFDDLIPNRT
ncbi:hypothetical protein O1611_g6608 [Lasiodiplodia mahajangana]|uniref:Uncharacterized protein n=1 Tax=Lasiodiplodia mahajangana TaxID=1108764 RepID=A0ACC2JHU1_9PEZI|nr:hypothetical protein O1611_g6608 [Lasiodiplodia mahajangana]